MSANIAFTLAAVLAAHEHIDQFLRLQRKQFETSNGPRQKRRTKDF